MCSKRLTVDDVVAHIGGICFKTGPPELLGIESEWLVTDPRQPHKHVPLPRLQAAVEAALPLPAASAVSYEPGGQLELSSLPQPGIAACYAAARADLAHIERHLGDAGLRLSGLGVDPYRSPTRQLDRPRYAAMEVYLDARDAAAATTVSDSTSRRPGRVMMCSTASVQICVDIGDTEREARERWELAYALGPVLVAMFAHSPLQAGRYTGWRSTRQAVWTAVDPCRTRPPGGGDPVEAWAQYALDAEVMALRRDAGPWLADPGMTFREWLEDGTGHGSPSCADLEYHLSTLFPPVRPRGCLELRMVDAQSPAYWGVPLAVVAALFDDPSAADAARQATEPVAGRWREAARDGLTDQALANAARDLLATALDSLPRLGAEPELIALVTEFADRYTERGRCPADDLLVNAEAEPPDPADRKEVVP